MALKSKLMDETAVLNALRRLSHQIADKNKMSELCLIGIKTRGVPIAKIILENLAEITGDNCLLGELDITLYRDDLTEIDEAALINSSNIPFDVRGKTVILCDDVIFTGRTARAAIDAVLKNGRAQRIQLAALIDRGHRELPLKADYVGKNVPTAKNEAISVKIKETDGETAVYLCEI